MGAKKKSSRFLTVLVFTEHDDSYFHESHVPFWSKQFENRCEFKIVYTLTDIRNTTCDICVVDGGAIGSTGEGYCRFGDIIDSKPNQIFLLSGGNGRIHYENLVRWMSDNTSGWKEKHNLIVCSLQGITHCISQELLK